MLQEARLILAMNSTANGQNLGIYAADEKNYTSEETFSITKPEPLDLTVEKLGKDNVKQANVNFRLGTSVSGEGFATWGSYTINEYGSI